MDELKAKLGRIHIPDERDKRFSIKSKLPLRESKKTYKYWWPNGWWGDQGYTAQCVAYSWGHWLNAGPITQNSKLGGEYTINPAHVYTEAQRIDRWPGENYDGTSVRAGAKVLQREGYIAEYSWAWDINTVIQALLEKGPLVVGTEWKYDMFFPNENGIITATGDSAGGHAYLLDGINVNKQLIRIKNSWGRNWGNKGFAYISFDDMDKLIKNYGEACLATEILK